MTKRRRPSSNLPSDESTYLSKEVGNPSGKKRRKKKRRKKSKSTTETPRWLAIALIGVGVLAVIVLAVIVFPIVQELNSTDDDDYVLKFRPAETIARGETDPFAATKSPSADDLRTHIADLPWNDPEMNAMAVLESPWRHDDTFEEIRLDHHDWGEGQESKFRIYWVRFAADETQQSFKHAPLDSVDAAVPIFEAFLDNQQNWSDGLNWEDTGYEKLE